VSRFWQLLRRIREVVQRRRAIIGTVSAESVDLDDLRLRQLVAWIFQDAEPATASLSAADRLAIVEEALIGLEAAGQALMGLPDADLSRLAADLLMTAAMAANTAADTTRAVLLVLREPTATQLPIQDEKG
jgi:hypothetical protein